jgi:C-terminal processing protease CtpA/Prc
MHWGALILGLVRPDSMLVHIVTRMAMGFALPLLFAQPSQAADQKLGIVTQVEGEGFFLNPVVKKILVTEVTKGSLAEAAGVRAGDQIIQIEKQNVAGRRAMELVPFLKLKPGETRTLRLKHADGTEADARITKPKT